MERLAVFIKERWEIFTSFIIIPFLLFMKFQFKISLQNFPKFLTLYRNTRPWILYLLLSQKKFKIDANEMRESTWEKQQKIQWKIVNEQEFLDFLKRGRHPNSLANMPIERIFSASIKIIFHLYRSSQAFRSSFGFIGIELLSADGLI